MLSKGWELANAMLPGLDEATRAAGAITINAMADMKEVRCRVTSRVHVRVLRSLLKSLAWCHQSIAPTH